MNYLVDPTSLLFNSHRIEGFTKMIGDEKIHQWDLLDTATEVAEEWTYDWDENQGFGSSDMTFMIKDFIDNVIHQFTSLNIYKTEFSPSLQIVKL